MFEVNSGFDAHAGLKVHAGSTMRPGGADRAAARARGVRAAASALLGALALGLGAQGCREDGSGSAANAEPAAESQPEAASVDFDPAWRETLEHPERVDLMRIDEAARDAAANAVHDPQAVRLLTDALASDRHLTISWASLLIDRMARLETKPEYLALADRIVSLEREGDEMLGAIAIHTVDVYSMYPLDTTGERLLDLLEDESLSSATRGYAARGVATAASREPGVVAGPWRERFRETGMGLLEADVAPLLRARVLEALVALKAIEKDRALRALESIAAAEDTVHEETIEALREAIEGSP